MQVRAVGINLENLTKLPRGSCYFHDVFMLPWMLQPLILQRIPHMEGNGAGEAIVFRHDRIHSPDLQKIFANEWIFLETPARFWRRCVLKTIVATST